MKTRILQKRILPAFFIFSLILLPLSLFAQIPAGFQYQAVARNQDGTLVENTNLTVRVAILQGGPQGTVMWQEDHASATNGFGLFSITVGDPDATPSGGSLSSFEEIDWGLGDYYLQVDVDLNDGNGFHAFDPVPFLSVPYAKVAGEMANGWVHMGDTLIFPTGSVAIGTDQANGTTLAVQGGDVLSGKPLFEVKRQDGQTVFAVYNDSIRMFVNANNTAKGPKGGFAIGGFGAAKGPVQDYLRISPDSVRVYIDQSAAKGPKGGFAIGGFGAAKGVATDLMHLDQDNYFIGHQSGENITTGLYNQFFGYQAGMNTTTGSRNIMLGYMAGMGNTAGSYNIFLGDQSGYNNGANYNIFIGYNSGLSNTSGYNNLYMGYQAGYDNTTGYNNVFIGNRSGYNNVDGIFNAFLGYESGFANTSGSRNSFFGYRSGHENTTGEWNAFFGFQAGYHNIDGSNNTMIGQNAGFYNTSGTYNTFIGYQSGFLNTTGSNNVFLGNGSGRSNTIGQYNVFIGMESGRSNQDGQYNTFLGYQAGYSNIGGTGSWEGDFNTFLGYQAGYNATSAYRNVAIGYMAGFGFTTNRYNVCIGEQTGLSLSTGQANVLIGTYAGSSLASGGGNIFLGLDAGYYATGSDNVMIGLGAGRSATGSSNVFLGAYAGYGETGSNKLYIENTTSSSPLIWGDFSLNRVVINGNASSNTNNRTFFVNGSAGGTGGWFSDSDVRLKRDIKTIPDALEKVKKLRGVNFNWRDTDTHEAGLQMGFIAQEAENVIPEVVNTTGEYYSMQYAPITALLVEAVKAQQKEIEALKAENRSLAALKKSNEKQQEEIAQLRQIVEKLQGSLDFLTENQ